MTEKKAGSDIAAENASLKKEVQSLRRKLSKLEPAPLEPAPPRVQVQGADLLGSYRASQRERVKKKRNIESAALEAAKKAISG